MSDIQDDAYVSEGANVVKDDAPVEEPNVKDPDSDAQIAADEKEAINEDNIIDSKTRGAKADYTEKEEDDLPAEVENDGTSRGAAK